MKNYYGLIIAIENYHDNKNITPVKYAANDAEQFLESLIGMGCDRDKFEYLSDNLATKTAILQKLKEISRNAQKEDTVIFYYAGHGFYNNGKNQISCVDTFLKSLDSSTIDIVQVLSALEESKSKKIIGFLDCCHSGIHFSSEERSPVTGFSTDDLKYQYGNAEHLTIFASCKEDEKSQVDMKRNHGVWSYYLIKALSGNARGIYEKNLLFSDKLQSYLSEKTYHRVKTITTNKKNQTPVKFGKETAERFIVADLSTKFSEIELQKNVSEIKFEGAVIKGSEEGYVRNLSGYKSNHRVPKEIDDYRNNWIKSLSREEIASELDRISGLLKSRLNYKRKDIRPPLIEDGYGQLVTDQFDYVVGIEQSQTAAGEYILTRTIENFKSSDILNNPIFNDIFSDTFDTLTFYFKKINVEEIIDLIENVADEEYISVEYKNTDTSFCRIYLKDFNGHIEVSETSFSIILDDEQSPQNLVIECQRAYAAVTSKGFPQLLNDSKKTLSS